MKNNKKKEIIIFIITAILIAIPIVLAFANPSYIVPETVKEGILKKRTVQKMVEYPGPFTGAGFASLYAIVIYSILLFRNKNNIFNFDNKKGINSKAVVLHCLDLIFLTTLCSLIKPDAKIAFLHIDCNVFILFGIIFSLFGIKTIAGFIWIIVAFCLCQTFISIDNWHKWFWLYTIPAYMSIVSQICILKLFKFDKNEFFADFGVVKNTISNDVYESARLTKKTINSGINVTKKVIARIPKEEIKDTIKTGIDTTKNTILSIPDKAKELKNDIIKKK